MSAQFDPILGQVRDGAVTLAEQMAGYNSGSAAEKAAFQSLVLGYRRYYGTYTQVLAITANPGDEAVVSNLGVAGVAMRWVVGRGWTITGTQQVLFSTALQSGLPTTGIQLVKTLPLPPGLLKLAAIWRVKVLFSKSNTTASAIVRTHLGTTGTVADVQVAGNINFGSGARAYAGSYELIFPTNTTLRSAGDPISGALPWSWSGQAQAIFTTACSDISGALNLSATMDMAAAGCIPEVSTFVLEAVS